MSAVWAGKLSVKATAACCASCVPAVMLNTNFVWTAQLAVVACLALCRCLFPGVVVSAAAVSVTS